LHRRAEKVRINIETSEGLAQSQWIDLMRADLRRFRKMVKTANGRGFLMEDFERCFGLEWLEREKARILFNATCVLTTGILNEHWRNGSGIDDVRAGGIAPPRTQIQRSCLCRTCIMSSANRARKPGQNSRSQTRLPSSPRN
jgi:hypothetical protein